MEMAMEAVMATSLLVQLPTVLDRTNSRLRLVGNLTVLPILLSHRALRVSRHKEDVLHSVVAAAALLLEGAVPSFPLRLVFSAVAVAFLSRRVVEDPVAELSVAVRLACDSMTSSIRYT